MASTIIKAGQDAPYFLTKEERAALMLGLHTEQDALSRDILDSMHNSPVLWDQYRQATLNR